jgi:type VI secretion system protein ImpF
MADLLPTERLQPSLLDRLTDDEPDKNQESREKRILSQRQLRQSVLRDLTWLMNSVAMTATQSLTAYADVSHSVLNFGIPDLSGRSVSNTDVRQLEQQIKQAILDFEPRITRNSLKLRVVKNADNFNQNALAFEIEGDLWMQPLPLRLYLKSEIDLETGHVELTDLGG